jgi:chemotaxis protein methyltransferase WspC
MTETLASPRGLSEIELRLRSTIGLDSSTVGSSLVLRAVERRLSECGIASIASYAERLASDAQELQELVELVVVPETYFFRESAAISDVVRRAMALRPTPTADSPLRLLSVPCSNGEEPYSVVMALLMAGFPLAAIAIDAIDISHAAIARAKRGEFRGGSFRGEVGEWMKYFSETKQGWELDRTVRAAVRVSHGNIADPGFKAPREQYDIIFCRNLLIYFDADSQSRALATLTRFLTPDGVLVVGSADSFAARRAGFEPIPGSERSFLFRLASRVRAIEPLATCPTGTKPPVRRMPVHPPRTATQLQRPVMSAILGPARRTPPDDGGDRIVSPSLFDEIGRLANDGRLALALELGEDAIRKGCATTEILALMGTTYAAVPDLARAEQCYRRALFLEPCNEEALLHLALLLEQRGEYAPAARLRARARTSLVSRALVAK